jgi:branched-chain amino acid transport system ATP-binding protein
LLLDEPMAGMTLRETQATIELIRRINQRGITIVLIEHNMAAVMEVCSTILVTNYGEKIAEGSPKEVTGNPAVLEAYLGSASDAGIG